jgi:hypothetical protein
MQNASYASILHTYRYVIETKETVKTEILFQHFGGSCKILPFEMNARRIFFEGNLKNKALEHRSLSHGILFTQWSKHADIKTPPWI